MRHLNPPRSRPLRICLSLVYAPRPEQRPLRWHIQFRARPKPARTAGIIAVNDATYAGGWSSAETRPSLAISARGLVQRFGEFRAVDGRGPAGPRGTGLARPGPDAG